MLRYSQNRPSSVNLFAEFLCIDIVVSGICRLVVVHYWLDMLDEHSDLCKTFESWRTPADFHDAAATNGQWHNTHSWDRMQRCRHIIDTIYFVAMALTVCTAVAQGALGLATRKYAQEMLESEPRIPVYDHDSKPVKVLELSG